MDGGREPIVIIANMGGKTVFSAGGVGYNMTVDMFILQFALYKKGSDDAK